MTRAIWFILGTLSLIVSVIAVPVPVLPTTPFVILAAYAFGKSSPRVERWLMENPTFGPMIVDWRAHGVIRLKYKIIGAVTMVALLLLSVAMGVKPRYLMIQAFCMACAALYVWTRPSNAPVQPE